jgi:bifunctional DNase/RNase
MGRLSKVKWCLLGCLIVVLALVVSSIFIPSRLTNAVMWVANHDFASKLRSQEADREHRLSEMVVETIGVSKIDYQPVVILKEKGGELYLPIWIGLLEANAISVILEGVELPRPLTPDLLCSIINRMGASVDYIVINDLRDKTFYANIILSASRTQMEIDARPSDAIAVALRVGVPIYVERAVLDKAGVHPDQEADKYTIVRHPDSLCITRGNY